MRQALIPAGLAIAVFAASSALGQMGGYGGGYGGSGFHSMSVRSKPDDYATALRLIHREEYADAIPYLERAQAARPHNADILNYLGRAHRMVGNYPGSLAWYQKALVEDPDRKDAHEDLGELYLNMHDVASARAQLGELARLCPSDCDERDTLTKSIDAYAAANPPARGTAVTPAATIPATTAPAVPPAPVSPKSSPSGND